MKTSKILLVLVILAAYAAPTAVQAQIEIVLVEQESKLWIEGSSTVNDIHCMAGSIVAYANVGRTELETTEQLTQDTNGEVNIEVPVWDFDCGRRRMNRDFYSALKAEDHPSINFEYYSSRLITNLEPGCHPFQLEVEGKLTVAGYGKEMTVMVDIEPCEANRFRLTGSKVINMLDFGIEPPSAMLGLIKAHEELEVFFSLTAEQKNSSSISNN